MPGALAPLIKQEFTLSDGQLGMLTGFAFSLCFAVCGIPLARFADRHSRRLLITVCLAVWSGLTILCGFTQNFWQLFVARLAVGGAESGSSPASFSLISDLFPTRQRPVAMGTYLAGMMAGVMFGLSAAGWAAAHYGWRSAFLLLGAPGLMVAAVAWFTMAEPERGASDEVSLALPRSVSRVGVGALLANSGFMWLMLGDALQGFSVLGLAQWMPMFFMRSHDVGLATIAIVFGIAFGVGMLFGQIVGGIWGSYLSRRHFAPLHVSIGSCFGVAPCYLIALWLSDVYLAFVMIFIAAFVSAMANPSASAAGQTIVPPHQRASAQAIINLAVALIGGGLGPVAVGLISDALTPHFGDEALRWSLVIVQILSVLAGLAFFKASLTIRRHCGIGAGAQTDRK